MTNEQLKAFIAVAETGSFRKAAQTIFKTQAAISAAVKSLEQEFEILLFNRSEYRPVLTEAGEAFLHNAKLTMNQFNRLDTIGHQLSSGIESTFNITVSIAFPMQTLLTEIKTISDQFPNTHFKVYPEVLNGVIERIDSDADLGFGPDINLTPQHEKVAISSVAFINVSTPDYFRHSSNKQVPFEEIENYAQIITRDSSVSGNSTSFNKVSNKKSWSVNDFHTKKELILAGLGWGGMPEHLVKDELQQGLLNPVNIEGLTSRTTGALYMFRRRDKKHGKIAQAFWQALTQSLGTKE